MASMDGAHLRSGAPDGGSVQGRRVAGRRPAKQAAEGSPSFLHRMDAAFEAGRGSGDGDTGAAGDEQGRGAPVPSQDAPAGVSGGIPAAARLVAARANLMRLSELVVSMQRRGEPWGRIQDARFLGMYAMDVYDRLNAENT